MYRRQIRPLRFHRSPWSGCSGETVSYRGYTSPIAAANAAGRLAELLGALAS